MPEQDTSNAPDATAPEMPQPKMPQQIPSDPLSQFFSFAHLPTHLQEMSKPFYDMHVWLLQSLSFNPERSEALRKLIEAKDCAVRAKIFKS